MWHTIIFLKKIILTLITKIRVTVIYNLQFEIQRESASQIFKLNSVQPPYQYDSWQSLERLSPGKSLSPSCHFSPASSSPSRHIPCGPLPGILSTASLGKWLLWLEVTFMQVSPKSPPWIWNCLALDLNFQVPTCGGLQRPGNVQTFCVHVHFSGEKSHNFLQILQWVCEPRDYQLSEVTCQEHPRPPDTNIRQWILKGRTESRWTPHWSTSTEHSSLPKQEAPQHASASPGGRPAASLNKVFLAKWPRPFVDILSSYFCAKKTRMSDKAWLTCLKYLLFGFLWKSLTSVILDKKYLNW